MERNGISYPMAIKSGVVYGKVYKNGVVSEPESALSIPHIYINTVEQGEINKEVYFTGTFEIQGNSVYPSLAVKTGRIKGRGNSTWLYPKKPYRIKLDSKTSIFGLPAAKDWVLLANYLDPTLMLNTVAMKTGELLEFPHANHMIPIDVTLNGEYKGSYAFTEQIEVGTGRVDIDKDAGLLLELDTYFDEEFQFISNIYDLPVMVKSPDLQDLEPSEAAQSLSAIQSGFNSLESLISSPDFPDNNYRDFFDVDSLARYIIIYNLTANREINHPKSVYMHKDVEGKYTMGPLWDFDWAFGYEETIPHFQGNEDLFVDEPMLGNVFFQRLLQDPFVVNIYRQVWEDFKATKFQQLLDYIDVYAGKLSDSKLADRAIWGTGSPDLLTDVGNLKNWLVNRIAVVDNHIDSLTPVVPPDENYLPGFSPITLIDRYEGDSFPETAYYFPVGAEAAIKCEAGVDAGIGIEQSGGANQGMFITCAGTPWRFTRYQWNWIGIDTSYQFPEDKGWMIFKRESVNNMSVYVTSDGGERVLIDNISFQLLETGDDLMLRFFKSGGNAALFYPQGKDLIQIV